MVTSVHTTTELRSAVKKLIWAVVAVPAASISSADARPSTCLRFSVVGPGGRQPLVARHQHGVGGERGAEHPVEREQGQQQQQPERAPRPRSAPTARPSWPWSAVAASCARQIGGRGLGR